MLTHFESIAQLKLMLDSKLGGSESRYSACVKSELWTIGYGGCVEDHMRARVLEEQKVKVDKELTKLRALVGEGEGGSFKEI